MQITKYKDDDMTVDLALAFQDYYPENMSHCYGCGRLNENGLQIKSFWTQNGEESICSFTPRPYHSAVPGFVYGGLLASLIDCHATGTASAAMYKAQGRSMDTNPPLRFVTGTLNVRYIKPTPLGVELILRGKVREISGKKVIIDVTLSAREEITVTGEVITFLLPENMAGF